MRNALRKVATRQRRTLALTAAFTAAVAYMAAQPSAHSIDYLATTISPSASMNGGSGNWTVTDPLAGGSNITFTTTFSINTQGSSTTYPRPITFGASTETKPAGAPEPAVTITTPTATFTGSASTHSTLVSIVAPDTPGAYAVKIHAVSGTSGGVGLGGGNGLIINFTVAEADDPTCNPAQTSLAVPEVCILYHQNSATVTAALTAGTASVSDKAISFKVDGVSYGAVTTDASGTASLELDTSAFLIGNHAVVASFAGDCDYAPTSMSGNLGVSYLFTGFQQPINADGSSVFGGRTVPVKVKIADANGQPVPDADAHVFFAFGTPAIVGTDAEPLANTNGDRGNAMRYDATADQYIFNWDVGALAAQNGTYTVRVDLGEGSCGAPHLATLSLKRKK
jgi:hypothetical protein